MVCKTLFTRRCMHCSGDILLFNVFFFVVAMLLTLWWMLCNYEYFEKKILNWNRWKIICKTKIAQVWTVYKWPVKCFFNHDVFFYFRNITTNFIACLNHIHNNWNIGSIKCYVLRLALWFWLNINKGFIAGKMYLLSA